MSETGGTSHLLFSEPETPEPILIPVASGCAALYTARAPEKETSNEDSGLIIPCGPGACVIAIADGAGGFRAGERASRLALDALVEAVSDARDEGTPLRDAILTGIENANQQILSLGIGAATTLAVVEVQDHTVRPYHVGDSMILVVGQRGRLKLQTVSHSPVGYAVEAGVIDEGAAMQHEERHLVSNVVGATDMRVEVGSTLALGARDTVVVASDGLFDNLHIEEIAETIRRGPLDASLLKLAGWARERMSTPEAGEPSKPDDLTTLLFRPTPCRGRHKR